MPFCGWLCTIPSTVKTVLAHSGCRLKVSLNKVSNEIEGALEMGRNALASQQTT
jgi:hypothetical protein